jgi:hypothetical protein
MSVGATSPPPEARHGRTAHRYAARPHPEYVVLDLGAGMGALIIHADPGMHGVEIEISPAADDAARQHKEVLERSIGGRPAFTAVFDRIPEGSYTLWVEDAARAREVSVVGGEVAELDWRGASR